MTAPVVANASCGGGVRLSAPVAESVIPAHVMTYAALAPVMEYVAGRVRRTSTRGYPRGTCSRCRVCRSAVTHTAPAPKGVYVSQVVLDVRGTSLLIFLRLHRHQLFFFAVATFQIASVSGDT